jgi:isoleucyl-tRNA synthetase
MSRYSTVRTDLHLPATEEAVLERWREDGTFERSLAQRADAPLYAFDDGPPFATGLPHYGHILTSYVKDVVPRYFTMRGYRVPRRWGWDCHGLPVEYEVEKELGLSGPADIAALGLGRFTEACRALVLRYATEWERIVTRLGRWVDFKDAYRTMDRSYMDSVLWAFHRLHELGLVYEGQKVVPYCCRCQTPLSNFEARLDDAYRPRTDLSCTVKFRLSGDPSTSFLAWTTTPWTLPANVALAVNPDIDYAECESADGEHVWLAVSAATRLKTRSGPLRVVKGRELLGQSYTPVFPYFASLPGAFVVLSAAFVSDSEGTGIVHLAPAFGEDDEAVCRSAGLSGPQPVAPNGTFTSEVPEFQGVSVFDASPRVVRHLADRGLVYDRADHLHPYPHCWRCDSPLIYRGVGSWFVRVTALKEQLLANNQAINWVPDHVRDGRFGQWLDNARDWAVSRNRFWGAPIPVWRCEGCAETLVIGSAAELEARAGRPVADLHRPYIDSVALPCNRCGSTMRRVPEVLDCWFESGAMPFAQLHYPFENTDTFRATCPADFIVEYVAQTRGWFYTLHVLSTALFHTPAFRHAVCHGVVLGTDGRKMSKRLRNYPDPMDLVSQHGSDALRVALLSSPVVRGADVRFDEEAVRDAARRFVVPLWNAFHYFTTYARLDHFEPTGTLAGASALDRYLLHETDSLRDTLESAMSGYDFGAAYDAIERYIETLSKWYLRLSRSRAWATDDSLEKRACYETLHLALDTTVRLLAPFMPFVTDALYQSIGNKVSVHLADWPAAQLDWRDHELADEMRSVRIVVTLARHVRERLGISHRHPLPALYVSGVETRIVVRHAELLEQEVNVKLVAPLTEPERFLRTEVRLNTPVLGKRLKGELKRLQRAVAEGDFAIGGDGTLVSGGVVVAPNEYWQRDVALDPHGPVAANASVVVVLDTTRDPALILEADARDLNRAVQDLRKHAKLDYSDRIVLSLSGPGLDDVLDTHGAWLREQCLVGELAARLEPSDAVGRVALSTGGVDLAIRRLSRSAHIGPE